MHAFSSWHAELSLANHHSLLKHFFRSKKTHSQCGDDGVSLLTVWFLWDSFSLFLVGACVIVRSEKLQRFLYYSHSFSGHQFQHSTPWGSVIMARPFSVVLFLWPVKAATILPVYLFWKRRMASSEAVAAIFQNIILCSVQFVVDNNVKYSFG